MKQQAAYNKSKAEHGKVKPVFIYLLKPYNRGLYDQIYKKPENTKRDQPLPFGNIKCQAHETDNN